MESKLTKALCLATQPVAVIWTDDQPTQGLTFKENKMTGCVASMLVAASKGRTAYFTRTTFGCPGGGTSLGFGDCYGPFPIHSFLSTGDEKLAEQMGRPNSAMAEGERFYREPAIARKWFESLPITDVPAEYVVFKPLDQVSAQDDVRVVVFFVNADHISALQILADYNRGSNQSTIAPFGGACQSILFAYAENENEYPRGVLGFFDIAQRRLVGKEILSYSVPYRLYTEMEVSVADSFLDTEPWHKLKKRQ